MIIKFEIGAHDRFINFIHYQVGNIFSGVCNPDPCQNHGNCIEDEENDTFMCEGCDAGWTGQKCSDSIDDCLSSPCLNGGDCIDKHMDYECSCTDTWSGVHCENCKLFLNNNNDYDIVKYFTWKRKIFCSKTEKKISSFKTRIDKGDTKFEIITPPRWGHPAVFEIDSWNF